MDIILATHNKNKVLEMEKALSSLIGDGRVLTAEEAGFTEDVEENGTTFEENALIKARSVSSKGCIAIADDSGLCCNALNGAPGIYSARYAGEPCDNAKNNEKLLKELAKFEDRSAYFVCAIGCVLPDGTEFTVRGEAHGTILTHLAGEGGFGYDPLFLVPELNKTFAVLTREEKHGVSHRGNALRLLKEELAKRI